MKQEPEIVGVRKLRAHLSAYLRHARQGEVITICDRRRQAVARIVAVTRSVDDELLDRLSAKGVVTQGHGKPPLPRPIRPRPGSRLASDIVIEDRR